jgi:hypothetical protein
VKRNHYISYPLRITPYVLRFTFPIITYASSPIPYVLRITHYALRFTFYLLRPLDPYLLLLWLFSFPALTPLLQATITQSDDGLLHLYRLVALDQAIQQGAWFPRWLPDLAYGYGFPLFVFYAPLSYYITIALKLSGLSLAGAFNGSLMLALLLAGTGVYFFVKDHLEPSAGLLAGVAYVYAPFPLLNSLSRGGLPAAWAMALFPFVFWSFGRLLRTSGVQNAVLPPQQQRSIANYLTPWLPASALLFGLALFSHNTLSLLFVPVFGFYLVVELLVGLIPAFKTINTAVVYPTVIKAGLALVLGAGLAAFFLIPAIAEQQFAQVERVIISPDFDFRFHFISLAELFSLPRLANTGLLNPEFPLTLGLPQAGLALIGLYTGVQSCLLRLRTQPSVIESLNLPISQSLPPALLIFTPLSLLIAIFMMLPVSLGLWERLPFIAFVQFPHRWLGPAAFSLAILSGAAVTFVPKRLGFWLTFAALSLIFIASVPLLYPRYYDRLPGAPTLADMMAYEHRSGVIGTTSFGEYLPIWVKQIPRESPLEPMYQAGGVIQRLDLAYLPSEAMVESAVYNFNRYEFVINSPQPYQAIFHTFYFPGWTALINDQPALTTPVTERGLIGVPLPPGRQRLQLFFQETPLRRTADVISIIALGITLILFGLNPIYHHYTAKNRTTNYASRTSHYGLRAFASLTGLGLIFILTKTLYLDHFDNPLKHTFDGATVAEADVARQVNFGDQVNLLGYDLDRRQAAPGQSFNLALYWQARRPLATNYSALAQLVDADSHLYAGQDNLHPGLLPTSQWPPWGFVRDLHTLQIPFGTPPGDYFLATGLYDPSSWVRLPATTGGDPGWPDVVAISVTLLKPERVPTLAELDITWPVQADFGPELRLLGATPERETLPRNDFLRLALFWEAKAKPTRDYQISVRLLAPGGETTLHQTGRPSHNRYPTTRWVPGERIRDNHALWIPAGFPAGTYRVQVQVVDETGQAVGEWVGVGTVG